MVGIRDIAKKAEVSISTVSYALNNSPRVSEATRKRIQTIAQEMNYIPNMAGQNLRKQKTDIIAVYLSSYQGTFYSELLEGMNTKANELGFDLIVCSGKRARLFLPQRLIDGILVIDMTYTDEELLKYADLKYPIVVLDRKLEHDNVKTVLLDNRTGSQAAVKDLIKKDVDKIYIISGPQKNYDSIERTKAAVEVAESEKIPYEIIVGNFDETSGYEAGSKIEIESWEKYGVFALNDEMALGIYNYMYENDIDIINQLIISGFDKNKVMQYLNPPIKSVYYSKYEWGAKAVTVLNDLIKEKETEDELIATYYGTN